MDPKHIATVMVEVNREDISSSIDGALKQVAQVVVESPEKEIFKTRLDAVLCSLL